MIGTEDALKYLECGIPDMLSDMDPETLDYYERFSNRMKYIAKKDIGVKPKYRKYIRKKSGYWTCGNCGFTIGEVCFKYCPNCGYRLIEFPHYEEDGKKEKI
jgi:rubrerythrin